jgi:hypothetical protein
MRFTLYVFILSFLVISCEAQIKETDKPTSSELRLYLLQTDRTDPGEYAFLYENLPRSFDSLNRLIKRQLVHPLEAAERGADPLELSQDGNTTDVESILMKLYERDSTGLYFDREYNDRLVVACYHHAILLASMLRYQGIPTRIRAGYSRFFEDKFGVRFSHVVCEAWLEKEQRWIMLDPDRELVDMDEKDWDLAGKAWFNLKEGKYDPEKYTASISLGLKGTIYLMALDAEFVSGNEKIYWNLPEIVLSDIKDFDDLNSSESEHLEVLATYLLDPDRKADSIRLHIDQAWLKATGNSYEEYIEIVLKRH